jgi:hypothetical protein
MFRMDEPKRPDKIEICRWLRFLGNPWQLLIEPRAKAPFTKSTNGNPKATAVDAVVLMQPLTQLMGSVEIFLSGAVPSANPGTGLSERTRWSGNCTQPLRIQCSLAVADSAWLQGNLPMPIRLL